MAAIITFKRFYTRNFIISCSVFILLLLLIPGVPGLKVTLQNPRPEITAGSGISQNPTGIAIAGVQEPGEDELAAISNNGKIQPLQSTRDYSDVLLIYNEVSSMSVQVAQYFQTTRGIADINMCNITTSTGEVIDRTTFNDVTTQIENYLEDNNLTDKINYMITTKGVPLKVSEQNTANDDWSNPLTIDRASFDQELSMIMGPYENQIGLGGFFLNPLFEETYEFSREEYGMFMVTRLTGYDFDDIKQMIDNANVSYGYHTGKFVLDVDPGKDGSPGYQSGNDWLRSADIILATRGYNTVLDQTDTFLTDETDVGGYASWGSNDGHYSTNWVSNFGLETDSSPADGIPDNWYLERDLGLDNYSRNDTWSYQGSWSFNITRNESNNNYTAISQNITIPSNVRYYLVGRVNCTNVSNDKGAHLMIRVYDGSNNLIQTLNGTTIKKGTTNNFVALGQLRYEPEPNAVKLTVSAVFSKSSGTVFFDSIRLFEIKPHNTWVPGAIAETFVSTGGRSFNIGTTYGQSLVADLIREGVSGIKGYVYEPYLSAIAHPDILFDRYTMGYNLAESYWYASQLYGWMGTVIGDPKMRPYHDLLPDAVILTENITLSNPTPNTQEVLQLYADVINHGNDTLNNLMVRFFLGDPEDNIKLGDKEIASLAPLQCARVNVSWNTLTYTQNQTISVIVDPERLIHEQDETNNFAQKEIYINLRPEILGKEYFAKEIARTETLVIMLNVYDYETLDHNLIPLGYCQLKNENEWINISNSAFYNISYWELTFAPDIYAGLGKYTFKFLLIDENNGSSLIYYDNSILTVNNNPPKVSEIGVIENATVPSNVPTFYRTDELVLYAICSDIEIIDTENASNLELELKYKPPSDGWYPVLNVLSYIGMVDGNNSRWETKLILDETSKLGLYDISARVKDLDNEYSSWNYNNASFELKNNLPWILNLTIDRAMLFRSEIAVITMNALDRETDPSAMDFELEYQLMNTINNELDDSLWSTELIVNLKYDGFQQVWGAEFVSTYATHPGDYYFRARVGDSDGNWSDWQLFSNQILTVMNNPPVVELGKLPSTVKEDEQIDFDATDSYDPENADSELIFTWEFGDGTASTGSKAVHAYTVRGDYEISLTIRDADGEETSVNTSINVINVAPIAEAVANKTIAYANESIMFTTPETWDTESDIDSLWYRWDFGDEVTVEGNDLNRTTHTYTASGIYYVTLTVFDDDGDNDSFVLKVRINTPPEPVDEDGDVEETEDDSGILNQMGAIIITGIIFIIICILLIWLLMVRPKSKRKKEHPVMPPTAEPLSERPLPLPSELLEDEPPQIPSPGIEEPISPKIVRQPTIKTIPPSLKPELEIEQEIPDEEGMSGYLGPAGQEDIEE